jgi:hypothetical protein
VLEYFANLVYNEWAKKEKRPKIEEQKHVLNLFDTIWSGTGHEAVSGKTHHDTNEEAAFLRVNKEEEEDEDEEEEEKDGEKDEEIYFEMPNKPRGRV